MGTHANLALTTMLSLNYATLSPDRLCNFDALLTLCSDMADTAVMNVRFMSLHASVIIPGHKLFVLMSIAHSEREARINVQLDLRPSSKFFLMQGGVLCTMRPCMGG